MIHKTYSNTDAIGKCYGVCLDACSELRGNGSLQATWIRNTLLHALCSTTHFDTKTVPPDIVYTHPTIATLAHFATEAISPTSSTGVTDVFTDKVSEMMSMVETYSRDFPNHRPSAIAISPKDTVLVTGTTGGFGTVLLAKLVESTEISHVFALNRSASNHPSLLSRQQSALERQGLDPALAASSKVTLLEADLSMDRLGLSPETYEMLCSQITHIIHNGEFTSVPCVQWSG